MEGLDHVQEVWRLVPECPGLLASSHGRLMVAPYLKKLPNGGVRSYGGEPTRGQWDGVRFIYIFRGRTYRVARLVCSAFNGLPQIGQVAMHVDENAKNNVPKNLEWGTQKQNLNAPGFIAYCKGRIGEKSPVVKARLKSSTT